MRSETGWASAHPDKLCRRCGGRLLCADLGAGRGCLWPGGDALL